MCLKSIANLSLACIMIPKAAIEIKENGKNLVLLRQSEILAKIEGENK